MSTKYIDLEALGYYNEKVTAKINAVEAKIPTKNSQLTNDSLYITNQTNGLTNYYLKTETYTQNEVDTKIANLIDSAPETMNTLNELAVAIQNNDSLIDTLDSAIGTKANDNAVVHLTGSETITGDKTFSSANNIHTVTIVDNNQDRPIIFGNTDNSSQSLRIDDTLRYNAGNKTLLTGNLRVSGNISDGTNNIAVANIATKSSLKTVATSGSYNDLTDKPDISGFITSATLNNYLPLSGGTITGFINLGTNQGFEAMTTSGNKFDVMKILNSTRFQVGGSYPELELRGKGTRPKYFVESATTGVEVALMSDLQNINVGIPIIRID